MNDDRGRDRAIVRAADLLARRSHGRAEVERKLSRTVGQAIAAEVTATLAAAGLVDDAEHAGEVARRRLEQGWGTLRIEHDLAAAGIDAATIRRTLDGIDPLDLAAAGRIAVGRRTGADAARRLATRGFDDDVAERFGATSDTDEA